MSVATLISSKVGKQGRRRRQLLSPSHLKKDIFRVEVIEKKKRQLTTNN